MLAVDAPLAARGVGEALTVRCIDEAALARERGGLHPLRHLDADRAPPVRRSVRPVPRRSVRSRCRLATSTCAHHVRAGSAREVRHCVRRRRRALLGELSGDDHRRRVRRSRRPTSWRPCSTATGGSPRSELEAWLDDIGPRLEPPVIVTPHAAPRVRPASPASAPGSPARARCSTSWSRPTPATRSRRANTYYELAMKLAHASAAIDLVPSPDEIAAIDGFRTMLLAAIDAGRRATPRPDRPTVGGRRRRGSRRPCRRNPSCRPSARSRTCSPSSTR